MHYLAGAFGNGQSASQSFSNFFSQGVGSDIQSLARVLGILVIIAGLFFAGRALLGGRGASAFKDIIFMILGAALLFNLALLGPVVDKGGTVVSDTVNFVSTL